MTSYITKRVQVLFRCIFKGTFCTFKNGYILKIKFRNSIGVSGKTPAEMCNCFFFLNSITKYIAEYFNFTELHYQLNQYVKIQLLSNYQLHCQFLKTKTAKICQIKCRQENNRSQCSVANLLLLLISFLNIYSHLYI